MYIELDARDPELTGEPETREGIFDEATVQGVKTLVYTVNDPREAHRVLTQGATGVFTDYPDVVTRAALSD